MSAWTTWWCSARHTCVASSKRTPATTTASEPTHRWTKMPQTIDAHGGSATSSRCLFSGDYIINTFEFDILTMDRYMVRTGRPPSQGWKTFLRNHAAGIASIDLFIIRTISFKLLYGLVILQHGRRRLARVCVTSNPTAEWIAGQVTEAFPWEEAPRFLIRDRDRAFGYAYTRRIRAMGIRDHPTAPRSPWQNGHVERLGAHHLSLDKDAPKFRRS
jgi:hypothetical protein